MKGYSSGIQGTDGDTVGDIILSDDQWTAPKVMVKGFLSRDVSLKTPEAAQDSSRPQKCTSLEWVELEPEKEETEVAEPTETVQGEEEVEKDESAEPAPEPEEEQVEVS